MPRFVILEHDHPVLHWDLMLDTGDLLRSWRLAELPRRGCEVAATTTADHRRLYLDYEGPVTGNRGKVVRWDAGTATWEEAADGQLILQLQGERLRGRARLAPRTPPEWTFLLDEPEAP